MRLRFGHVVEPRPSADHIQTTAPNQSPQLTLNDARFVAAQLERAQSVARMEEVLERSLQQLAQVHASCIHSCLCMWVIVIDMPFAALWHVSTRQK